MADDTNPKPTPGGNTADLSAGTDTAALDNTVQAVQQATDEAEAKGYYGERPGDDDPSDYTLAAVTGQAKAKRK